MDIANLVFACSLLIGAILAFCIIFAWKSYRFYRSSKKTKVNKEERKTIRKKKKYLEKSLRKMTVSPILNYYYSELFSYSKTIEECYDLFKKLDIDKRIKYNSIKELYEAIEKSENNKYYDDN